MKPRTGGPAGNARLTAWTGLVLLVLFLVEGVTLLSLDSLVGVHILIGAALVPVAAGAGAAWATGYAARIGFCFKSAKVNSSARSIGI